MNKAGVSSEVVLKKVEKVCDEFVGSFNDAETRSALVVGITKALSDLGTEAGVACTAAMNDCVIVDACVIRFSLSTLNLTTFYRYSSTGLAVETSSLVSPGTLYRHYKGGYYYVIAVATQESDRSAQQVVYRGSCGVVCRPLSEFEGMVSTGVPRFSPVSRVPVLPSEKPLDAILKSCRAIQWGESKDCLHEQLLDMLKVAVLVGNVEAADVIKNLIVSK